MYLILILEKYGDSIKCKFPGKLQKNATYSELCEKASLGYYQFVIYQKGKLLFDFYEMNPSQNALCICSKFGLTSSFVHVESILICSPVEVFEYQPQHF